MTKTISKGVVHAVPKDVRETLVANTKLLDAWENITPLARNEWLCFIDSAKKDETRMGRIQRLQGDLLRGKKRPCCWAGCPHRS